jgi:hypothetical protein
VFRTSVCSLILLLSLQGPSQGAHAAEGLERAQQHYESGVSLFESGNKEQALIEFQLANEIAPKKENIFMLAQCEYHLGQLVNARTHYQAYLAEQSQGELADLARVRISAINRRPGVFAINTVPDEVEIRIEGEGKTIVGQAPNEFRVPYGRYRVTVSKTNYASETRELSIEVAETKPLFFKLEPIPAHLIVHTVPERATLFVRGNRTQNPYEQDVPPGIYELYAESSYYQPKRETITLGPGETREIELELNYVQRSGRPELLGFWTGIGAVGGGLAVLTQGNPADQDYSLSLPLFSAGVLAGGLALGVLSSTTPLVPKYIRDNRALFRIGAMWVGDLEGAALTMALTQKWTPTWLGGMAGLAGGHIAGWWLDEKAPKYGRVALIQSAALLGALAGAIAVPAAGWYPAEPDLTSFTEDQKEQKTAVTNQYHIDIKRRLGWGILAGLNVGLGAGLAMAYLPDQREYGPTWQRVLMVDMAGLAGTVFATTVELCTRKRDNNVRIHCASEEKTILNQRTARFALVGTGIGLIAGYLLTMDFDQDSKTSRSERPPLSFIPMPGVIPVESSTGSAALLPGLLTQGRF